VPHRARPETAPLHAPRPPQPQPDALLALQRGAGNAAVSRLLSRQPADVFQLPSKQPDNASHIGDDPLAQARSMPPAEPTPVERELLAELRGRVRFRAGLCFTKYAEAAAELKQEHAAADAAPSFMETLIDLAVGALAPGLVGFVLKPLREELKTIASAAIERLVKDGDRQIQAYMAADSLVEKLLANEARSANAWQALKSAWVKSNVPPGMAVGPMLDAFVEEFSVYLDALSDHLAGMPAADQVGAYVMFDPHKATKHLYKLQIENLLHQHQEIARDQVVWLEWYGRRRLAIVTWEKGYADAYWRFVRWVSDETWDAALATGPGGPFAPDRQFIPGRHAGSVFGVTAPWVGERFAEITVHGRPHMAKVQAKGVTENEFISWVDPADEVFARSQADLQYGGITRIKEGALPALPPPPSAGGQAE
jgi:hypothetical protein